jgi:hypothetical protein
LEKTEEKRNGNSNSSTLSSPWTFFVATVTWTWFFWILASALMLNMDTAVGVVLLLPGVLGPKVTGISFAYLTYGQEDRRDYWRCIIDFKRIGHSSVCAHS